MLNEGTIVFNAFIEIKLEIVQIKICTYGTKYIYSFHSYMRVKLAYLFWREPRCAGAEDRQAVTPPSSPVNGFP